MKKPKTTFLQNSKIYFKSSGERTSKENISLYSFGAPKNNPTVQPSIYYPISNSYNSQDINNLASLSSTEESPYPIIDFDVTTISNNLINITCSQPLTPTPSPTPSPTPNNLSSSSSSNINLSSSSSSSNTETPYIIIYGCGFGDSSANDTYEYFNQINGYRTYASASGAYIYRNTNVNPHQWSITLGFSAEAGTVVYVSESFDVINSSWIVTDYGTSPAGVTQENLCSSSSS
jgi:hypothetical protein